MSEKNTVVEENPTGAMAAEEIGTKAPINMEIPERLNQQQALQVLVDAARAAQAKGIFTLDDAELVNKAIKAFMPPTNEGPVPSNM